MGLIWNYLPERQNQIAPADALIEDSSSHVEANAVPRPSVEQGGILILMRLEPGVRGARLCGVSRPCWRRCRSVRTLRFHFRGLSPKNHDARDVDIAVASPIEFLRP